MKYIYNNKVLKHNLHSDFDGDYRLREFESNYAIDDVAYIKGEATKYIELVHDKEYIEYIKRCCANKEQVAETDLTPASYDAMLISAYITIKASESNDFAIIRPAGHHARRDKASGFCFFNNVAIATQNYLNQGKRVCIIDIDGHHGDGTQDIFTDNSDVMFISVHQDEVYPNTGRADDIGVGESYKRVINIPLKKYSGDKILLEAIEFASKYIKQFNPDVIAMSCGFDGYVKDRLLKLDYTSRGFYEVGKLIRSFNMQTFAVLEGGYHDYMYECVMSFIDGYNDSEYEYNSEINAIEDEYCRDHFTEVKEIIDRLYDQS